jgi:hypothetical protein
MMTSSSVEPGLAGFDSKKSQEEFFEIIIVGGSAAVAGFVRQMQGGRKHTDTHLIP